jgi:hypothetical protein
VLTVTLLFPVFGSVVVELTVSCCVTDPVAAFEGIVTTKVKAVVVAPEARFVVAVHVNVATLQFHPAGPVSDTAVAAGVVVGSVSTSFGVAALAGPPLVTVCV